VRQALDEARVLARQAADRSDSPQQWEKTLGLALSAVKRAQGLQEAGEPDVSDELRQEVARARTRLEASERERRLIADLDDIFLRIIDLKSGKIDDAGTVRRYRQAFRKHGPDVLALPPGEAARLLQASPRRDLLLAALWQWESKTDVKEEQRRLEQVALAATPDPAALSNRWRKALRTLDRPALLALAREAEGLRLPPVLLMSFSLDLLKVKAIDQATALLREGHQRHPGNFLLNFGLGSYLVMHRPKEIEGIRYLTAARAMRWNSAMAHLALGIALNSYRPCPEASACMRKALEIDPRFAIAHLSLGRVLQQEGKGDAAIACFRRYVELKPESAPGHFLLALALRARGKTAEALASWNKATSLKFEMPDAYKGQFMAGFHSELGDVLRDQGKLDEAEAAFRKALAIDPKHADAHNGLGNVLMDRGQPDRALLAFRKALEYDPKKAAPHNGLGNALYRKGRTDEALLAYRQALQCDPNYTLAHTNLGNALQVKGKLDEAIASYRKAIELAPTQVYPHVGLGNVLMARRQYEEAQASYRKAIASNPRYAEGHNGLANALYAQGKVDEAIASAHEAIKLQPKSAMFHTNLAIALVGKGKIDEAIARYRKAIECGPRYAWAYLGLGKAYLERGQSREAVAEYRKCIDLLPGLQALDRKVGAVEAGKVKLTGWRERVELAIFCQNFRLRYTLACRLYTEAFSDNPALLDDLLASHRGNAACVAALAGCGKGEDAGTLDDAQKARFRKQALDWLTSDLAARSKQAGSGKPAEQEAVRRVFAHWQKVRDFVGVRNTEELEKLPREERLAWRKLWDRVEELAKADRANRGAPDR
jgi:tetratricopeptide (TPR) repeat protein